MLKLTILTTLFKKQERYISKGLTAALWSPASFSKTVARTRYAV
jgi:hypothetical protein